jgi:Sigma-70, region 4
MAALALLERLTPEQRAVFVLHEVFSFPFGKVADVIGKSEAACRQLASRARRVMEDGRPRFDVDRREREKLRPRRRRLGPDAQDPARPPPIGPGEPAAAREPGADETASYRRQPDIWKRTLVR